MNTVILKGNLARDPEIRSVKSGDRQTTVANFTVAVSRHFKRANGERDKDTTFIPCEAWDSGAEHIGTLLKKGDPVLLQGSLKVEQWEKDGVKHSRMKVRVSNFDKLHRKGTSEDGHASANPVEVGAGASEDGQGIPF